MLFSRFTKSDSLPDRETAMPDRQQVIQVNPRHYVTGNPIVAPIPEPIRQVVFGLGCFWGAERKFWQLPGVFSTAVGYAGGITANPTYEDVCSGATGHTEVVLVYYDPESVSYEQLLQVFWEAHDPTQGMRQGNDRGTQYRSAIYPVDGQQKQLAKASLARYQENLEQAGYGPVTTEIKTLEHFYYAEDYHQQYLAKNPAGYCGLGGTGVCFSADESSS